MLTESLLLLILFLLVALIVLFLQKGVVRPSDVQSAVSDAWVTLGLGEKVGRLETYAQDIRKDYRSLEQMLRVPTERASFGEMALEAVLTDQLPPGMFGVRQRVLQGLVPDAHIQSTAGTICIDSKFPLENYRRTLEASTPEEKGRSGKQFLRDVKTHLEKIRSDYVCPERGSAEFAFAYIPSEGVYWFLINDGYKLLRDYARKGVQVVSPLTLTHKIELIKAGVHARKLSEEAVKIRDDLGRLSVAFQGIDQTWSTFYTTHLKNLRNKAQEVDTSYSALRDEFENISHLR